MKAVVYSTFRKNLKSYLREIRDDSDVLLITNNDPTENAVLMNAQEYESLMETVRIYENPAQYEKLKNAIKEAEEGNLTVRELIDD